MMQRLAFILTTVVLLAACQTQPGPGGGNGQNQPPTANFSASPTSGAAPLTVNFDASSSTAPDGVIASYSWNFGDGETASGQTTSHTFESAGSFTVRLTVTDNAGQTDSAEQVISVTGADGNLPPTASFTASPSEGEAPLTVTFDASGSSDPDGAIVSYAWDFGNGETATGLTANHTFDSAGTFTVTLSVTDDGGATATDTTTIEVQDGGTPGNGQEVQTTGTTFAIAEAVPTLPDLYLAGSVDVALLATQLTGSSTLVVSGTVTQTGPNSYSYDASPSDRLRAVFSDGREFEIVFSELEGEDFSEDGSRFINSQHRAAAQVTSNAAAGSLDLTLQSFKLSGDRGRLIQGAFTDESGVRWTADVQTRGTYASEVDVGIAENESDDLIQGTLSAEALGLEVTLNKRHIYKFINLVENVRHVIDHSWTWNGSQYRLQLEVFVAFREAQPVDTDQWIIQGGLSRDGAVIGQVQAAEDPTGLEIWLQLGSERIDLFRFSYL